MGATGVSTLVHVALFNKCDVCAVPGRSRAKGWGTARRFSERRIRLLFSVAAWLGTDGPEGTLAVVGRCVSMWRHLIWSNYFVPVHMGHWWHGGSGCVGYD